jgi:Flp pilus assembly pilin Flp
MSLVERAWVTWLVTSARWREGLSHRQHGWGLIEFAVGVLVLVMTASVGLKMLGNDLSTLFTDLGAALKMPGGGIGGGSGG